MGPWQWLVEHLSQASGTSSSSSRAYNFWSGFGGDIGLFAGVGVYLRHKNCHTKGCWRPGHPDANGVVVCRKHA